MERLSPPWRGGGTRVRESIEITGALPDPYRAILTDPALRFVAELTRTFRAKREELLGRRVDRQRDLDAGADPAFQHETASIRRGDWVVAHIPPDLKDRRVEITGPVDRKMIINALNSGANVFMADFEDSNSPTWRNVVEGQINLRDAVRREIGFTAETGKQYSLNESVATLMVRPRGLHLDERHMLVDGAPVPASLFDFGLFFFHNAKEQMGRGTGPYFYLPKLESHREARWWNRVFVAAQKRLGIPHGTIRATVLIETILAAFEMEEILYALHEHSAGLNCGRWDYIFSFIKKFRNRSGCVLPDRAAVTMATHFMRSYSLLLIRTCHRRGIHAMGGMAAQIPIKSDPERNAAAIAKVVADKEREAGDGHDGTWVAHPGLVPVAREVFDRHMPGVNQIDRQREDLEISAEDLLRVPDGAITRSGLDVNVAVSLRYLEAWLRGNGCVPIFDLMEDAATAEISRAQLWQWIRHGARLDDGTPVTRELVHERIAKELETLRADLGEEAFAASRFDDAAALFERISTADDFIEFLTLPAYDLLKETDQ
jgi:malate synthase